MPISKPPKDKESRAYRKWEESLSRQSEDTDPLASAPFVTLGNSNLTTNERALTGSDNIEITDGGAGSGVSIDLTETGVAEGTYSRPTVTVDDKGRVTNIATSTLGYIPQLDADPASPSAEEVWVLRTVTGTFANGEAMGPLGCTYHNSSGGTSAYELRYQTEEGNIVGVALT